MNFLGKKYKRVESENFDELLKELGINYILRLAATAATPTLILEKIEDGSYILTNITPVKTFKTVFRLGEEFEEIRGDGIKLKTTITMEGNLMKQVQKDTKGFVTIIEREYFDDSMIERGSIEGKDVKSVQRFEVIP